MHKNSMKRKSTFTVVITEMTIFWVSHPVGLGPMALFQGTHFFHLWSDRIISWQTFLKNRRQPIMLCGVIIWTILTGLTNTCVRHIPGKAQW